MTIAVLITTYNRKDILHETLMRASGKLGYGGKIEFVIADDGSTDGTQLMLSQNFDVHLVQSERKGLGGNTNAGLARAFSLSDVVVQFQDDMWLDVPTDINPVVRLLEADSSVGWVRFGRYNSPHHRFNASLEGDYWRIHWNSPEFYVTSDQPHIKHKRFHEWAGYYPEGLKIADTENTWCGHTKGKAQEDANAPKVLIPVWIPENIWRHVGDSWQSKDM